MILGRELQTTLFLCLALQTGVDRVQLSRFYAHRSRVRPNVNTEAAPKLHRRGLYRKTPLGSSMVDPYHRSGGGSSV